MCKVDDRIQVILFLLDDFFENFVAHLSTKRFFFQTFSGTLFYKSLLAAGSNNIERRISFKNHD